MIDISTPVVLRPKKGRPLLFLLGALLFFVPLGVWMLRGGKFSGWIIVALGLMAIAQSAAKLLCPWLYYLRVSSAGLELHGLFLTQRYRWSDVQKFYAGYAGRMKAVRMRYAPSYEPHGIWRTVSNALGEEHEGAITDRYGLSQEALAAYLNQWKALVEQANKAGAG
jgi:hypothetical protein